MLLMLSVVLVENEEYLKLYGWEYLIIMILFSSIIDANKKLFASTRPR